LCLAVFDTTRKIETDVREATLVISEDELRARVSYDPETGNFYRKNSKNEITPAGVTDRNGYLVLRFRKGRQRQKVYAHRAAFFLTYGRWPKQLDHANGDKTDNRLCNLRECTAAQNGVNKKTPGGACGYRGVEFRPDKCRGKPYRARIGFNNKKTELGHFLTAAEAAQAYDRVARELHGEFARLNFA
jgi:hypothetical protein